MTDEVNRAPLKADPTVVFVHGQPGSVEEFSNIIVRLPECVSVITYDRPGWGESLAAADDLPANAAFLGRLLEKATPSSVLLVGNSYGAAVAIRAALDFPERVVGMVLIAPVGGVASISKVDSLLAHFGGVIRVVTWLERWLRPDSVRSFVSFQAEQGHLWRDLEDLSSELERILVPVTLLAGQDDWLNPIGGTLMLHERMRTSRLRIISGAGHLALVQAPVEVAAGILEMLTLVTSQER